MSMLTTPASTKARNEPVPAMSSATGAITKTEAAGVTADSETTTLPSALIERDSSCR